MFVQTSVIIEPELALQEKDKVDGFQ